LNSLPRYVSHKRNHATTSYMAIAPPYRIKSRIHNVSRSMLSIYHFACLFSNTCG
jgi:hypothetical protein